MYPFEFLKHIRDAVLPFNCTQPEEILVVPEYSTIFLHKEHSTYTGEIHNDAREWRNGGVVSITELETDLDNKGPSKSI